MRAVILDGIVLGLRFGLLGVGLTLVFGLGGVLNLAHGQIAVFGAIMVKVLMDAGAPTWVAILGGLVSAGLVGLLIDRTIMRAVYRLRGESRVLLSLLLMLGVSFVIDGLLEWKYAQTALGFNVGGGLVNIIGVDMPVGRLIASAITLAAGGALIAFFRYTVTGRAVRSVIQDEEGARLCGINPSVVRSLIFAVSGVLAAMIAITQSMTVPIGASDGINLTILALIVAVVGGLGSVSGALAAGILLGIVNSMGSYYIGSYITTIILLAAAALTIVLRPEGLLGDRP